MDALSPSDPCQTIVCKFASQTGKTEILLNFLGFIIAQDPGPCLVVQPNSKPMGEAFSKDRIAPMLRDTPALKTLVRAAKGRDSANTMLHKSFPGGHITIGGANSPAGLASRPIRYLLGDELDRWEVTKEGSALALARKRTRTFFNRKVLLVSSPTYADLGISAEYDNCEQQYEWHLTCPDCGGTQMPKLRHFNWPKDAPQDAVYVCESCGTAHDLDQQDRIKASGAWVCVRDDGIDSKAFWMNQWASPFARWQETIAEFRDAKKDPAKLQAVVNTAFAEPWELDGEGIDMSELDERREDYPAPVPQPAVVLTAGVDIQEDRIEATVFGWGDGEECFVVDHQILAGDTQAADVWNDLHKALLGVYAHQSGAEIPISAACIDSSFRTSVVYNWLKRHRGERWFAVKGRAGPSIPIVEDEKTRLRKRRKRDVHTIGVDEAKHTLYARLRKTESGAGSIHFPRERWCDEEYFAQLTAEKMTTKYLRGFPRREWVKTRPRNEALDCFVYGLAALRLLNPNYRVIAQRLTPREAPQEEKPQPARPVMRPRRRSNFVTGWK